MVYGCTPLDVNTSKEHEFDQARVFLFTALTTLLRPVGTSLSVAALGYFRTVAHLKVDRYGSYGCTACNKAYHNEFHNSKLFIYQLCSAYVNNSGQGIYIPIHFAYGKL